MAFIMKFSTDNAAFGEPAEGRAYPDGNPPSDECRAEAARILRAVARRIEAGEDTTHYLTVLDINGNDVGRFRLLQEPA